MNIIIGVHGNKNILTITMALDEMIIKSNSNGMRVVSFFDDTYKLFYK